MSEINETLQALRDEATSLGLTYSNAAKEDRLREMIAAARAAGPEPVEPPVAKPRTVVDAKARARAEATKLVRVKVICRNPEKANWNGEVFSAGNRVVGYQKKFVPFGSHHPGWHIPYILYLFIKEKMYLHTTEIKDRRTGKSRPESKFVPEFEVMLLPDLTAQELDDLRAAQAANHSIDKE